MFDSIDLSTSFWESAARLLLAVACGAVIGWDREARNRDAGLRTYMMVALGAAGFTLVAIEVFEAIAARDTNASGDAVRIIAAIVGGVGFLGAGVIMQSGGKVRGLTTAAGIWVIAAAGVSAGAGYYSNAVLVTALAFVTLVVLRRFETAVIDPSGEPER